MSKERLEEIKDKYMDAEYDFNLNKHDINWLIEQAERVQEYDKELISLEDNKHYVSEILAKNKRYREAIEKAIEMISESTGTITTPKEMSLYDAWILKSMLRETVLEGEE